MASARTYLKQLAGDPGLGWRRVPVEDEAFPKMRRGWPDEWARG